MDSDDNDTSGVNSIQIGDFSDTIYTSDSVYTVADADSTVDISLDPTWASTNFDWNTLDSLTITPEITIGKHTLDERKLEKLLALLDLIDNDTELKDLLQSQIAVRKLSGTD